MPSIRLDIISIGTLSRNRLWNENQALRTPHATTSLVRIGKRNILVDPGLPAQAIAARLNERTGLLPSDIDTIFLTNFRPSHRELDRRVYPREILIHEIEQQSARQHLERMISQAPDEDIDRKQMEQELELLETMKLPEDTLAPGVDLFPLFGYTPGTCGLIVAAPTTTTIIAGDAVPTQDHYLAGQLLPDTFDLELAKAALAEVYEIADLIVPGHDNIFLNPRMATI